MKSWKIAGLAALGLAAGQAASAPQQPVTGPIAVYWMSAATTSGMGAMDMGGIGAGGRPSGAMAGRMYSRAMMDPNAVSHTLVLQLGSTRRPQSSPEAEHDAPQGLGAGPVLPLLTPQAQPVHEEPAEPGPPREYQPPHGRMLIFWGCGEHAGPGQPLVIDYASLGSVAGAQRMAALMHGIAVSAEQPPSPGRYATYGEWPNERSSDPIPAEGSLQGDHTVKGDYSPDIHFSLAADQDFLPPIQLTANQKNPSGSASLAWRHVDGALGYFATMMGSSGDNTAVMWTSAQVQATAFGLPEYLSDGEIARLVTDHVLMPKEQTQCLIPQEAVEAAGRGGFFHLTAYGGEANFAYPPRPPAPQPWHIEWKAKVRYRAATGGILGMDMSQMMGGRGREEGEEPDQSQEERREQQEERRRNGGGFNPFGGFIP
jgi:hypothetical protein